MTYRPLVFPDPEAQASNEETLTSKSWIFRVTSGLLISAALVTLCLWKLQTLQAPQDADVWASQMKMSDYYYPPCPTGTFHQCPESWEGGYHCLHGTTFHHAKSYEKYNCRHVDEGPFSLKECLNQCRIGHFGKGRWAAHPYESSKTVVHHVVHHYYDGSDYLNGQGPAPVDGYVDGSDYLTGKGPAPVDGYVDGSDYLNGKGPAPVDSYVDGSDYLNGKGPAPVDGYVDGSDYLNGKGPAPMDGYVDGSDYLNGKGPAPVDGYVDGSDYLNGKGPAPMDGYVNT